MKKHRKKITILVFTACVFLAGLLLNLKVTSRQGVNCEVRTVRQPLYIKIMDFYLRHYHYQETAKEITKGVSSPQEKVFRIFRWVHENIRPVPEGFPVIDDHAWHIIIRGCGTNDQASDVFSTLCNYSGQPATFSFLRNNNRTVQITLSYVRLDNAWRVFDPCRGVYFQNRAGGLASIPELKKGDYQAVSLDEENTLDYTEFIKHIPEFNDIGLGRANIQSPLRRFLYQARECLGLNRSIQQGKEE